MRTIVYGAGAIGGVIGARLAQHGHDVALVARGAHAQAMRNGGITIETPDERTLVPVPVAEHPGELDIGAHDAVLLCVKSQDTVDALTALRECAPLDVAVVCVQNGVDNERAALRLFPNVYGVCVMCPASHLAPGEVQAWSTPVTGLLDIGRYPASVDDVSEHLAAMFRAATFESVPRPDIMRWKYAKLLMNLGNALEAACGHDERGGDLGRRAREEGEACLRAAGIDFASQEEDTERRGDLLRMRPIGGTRRGGGSSWQSLHRATGTIEADHLNGEIVLLGRLHGVPTPVNEMLRQVANEMAAAHAMPGSLAPDELLTRLAARSDEAAR
jgi:2-dehydropantoate 2-reductase